jgi:hypothetical protein
LFPASDCADPAAGAATMSNPASSDATILDVDVIYPPGLEKS